MKSGELLNRYLVFGHADLQRFLQCPIGMGFNCNQDDSRSATYKVALLRTNPNWQIRLYALIGPPIEPKDRTPKGTTLSLR